MEFTKPLTSGFTIYTKTGCPYCDKAKDLLKNEKIVLIVNCDDYLIKDKEVFLKFIEKIAGIQHRTFPMVFKDGEFIGGFTEIKSYYDKLTAFQQIENENKKRENMEDYYYFFESF